MHLPAPATSTRSRGQSGPRRPLSRPTYYSAPVLPTVTPAPKADSCRSAPSGAPPPEEAAARAPRGTGPSMCEAGAPRRALPGRWSAVKGRIVAREGHARCVPADDPALGAAVVRAQSGDEAGSRASAHQNPTTDRQLRAGDRRGAGGPWAPSRCTGRLAGRTGDRAPTRPGRPGRGRPRGRLDGPAAVPDDRVPDAQGPGGVAPHRGDGRHGHLRRGPAALRRSPDGPNTPDQDRRVPDQRQSGTTPRRPGRRASSAAAGRASADLPHRAGLAGRAHPGLRPR
ncbi:hypothetical protein FHS41_007441 [Streptomyces violarus]|uniref:Uncharacterized protein n=1 Tax=Streptomyces violarus TaxID=67380 RepID=A0A7W4ZYE7_9ACTN|nr:hypothetical protein [Streptomyces violarus]